MTLRKQPLLVCHKTKPTPPNDQHLIQGQIFKRSLIALNLEVSFS